MNEALQADVDIHDGIVSQRTGLRHSQRAPVNDTARYP